MGCCGGVGKILCKKCGYVEDFCYFRLLNMLVSRYLSLRVARSCRCCVCNSEYEALENGLLQRPSRRVARTGFGVFSCFTFDYFAISFLWKE